MKFCTVCNATFDDDKRFCPDDGEVLQESHENLVGHVIDGKYRIEGFIAQGGMGALYRARHILLGDEVVIKTLRSEMRSNSEWLRRFQREGKAARAFRHPNSVTVFDLSAGSDGLIYMVMEYVEGRTLDEELRRRGRFTPEEALEVLAPVADVLDAAHARGVVHRDLKPENIMLGYTDDRRRAVVKVLDLGIAKLTGASDPHASEATSLTVAGQILGTPYYMSPEQWGELQRDGNPEIDGRADIYSLGVILFELVAGQKPLGGKTVSELRHKHVAAPLPALSAVASDVPEAFSRAVERALAKDRNDRPATAGELAAELRAALGLTAKEGAGGFVKIDAAGSNSPSPRAGSEAATAHLSPRVDTSKSSTDPETRREPRERREAAAGLAFDGGAPRTSHAQPSAETRAMVNEHHAPVAASAADLPVRKPESHAEPLPETSSASQTSHANSPAASRRSVLIPLIAGGALALLVVLSVGGWYVFNRMRAGSEVVDAPPAPATSGASANVAATETAAPKVEAMSYWLETFDSLEDPKGERVADPSAQLSSGERFVIHFSSPERGYLYIIGPGAGGNALITLLTAQGAGQLKSNLVGAGSDFTFPFGGAKLKLDDNPGAEDFTVIFSRVPLLAPEFLTKPFLHELTPAEVREFEDFRLKHEAERRPEFEVKDAGGEKRVAVVVPESAASERRPLIFDLRIDHK